jgi:hypothetical protein
MILNGILNGFKFFRNMETGHKIKVSCLFIILSIALLTSPYFNQPSFAFSGGDCINSQLLVVTGSVFDFSGIEPGSVAVNVDGSSPDEFYYEIIDPFWGNWTATFYSLPDGAHSLEATAIDSCGSGNTATEGPISFTVDTIAPTVNIVLPTDGSYIYSSIIQVIVEANDDNGIMFISASAVGEFWQDEIPLVWTGDYYIGIFTDVPHGTLTITAMALDGCGSGNIGISPEVNVMVIVNPEILLSELDEGPAYRFDTLQVDSQCDEDNDLCNLAMIVDLFLPDYIASEEFNVIIVSLGPTTSVEISDIELAQVMGIRDWANDPEWGGLNQFYVDTESVDPGTGLVKTTMRGKSYYESFLTGLTDGPMALPLELVGEEFYLIPPLYDLTLSAGIVGDGLTGGVIEAVAELDDVADLVMNLLYPIDKATAIYYLTVDASEIGFPGPLAGFPTVDRDGDGFPESYRIRLSFDASQVNLAPSYYPEWEISISVSQPIISADDVFGPPPHGPITLKAAITADGNLPAGPSSRVVEFEVIYSPDPGALPLGTPTVATITDENGIATTWIVAGGLPTKAGPVIIKVTVPVCNDNATITVEPGLPVSGVTGLCAWDERASAIGLTERDVCEEIELVVLLAKADQFFNPIPTLPIVGETINFTSADVTPNPGTDATDANGLARSVVDASGLTPGSSAIVEASWTGTTTLTVDFTLTKVEVPHLACFLGEPAFRVDTLKISAELVRCEDLACSNCLADRSCNSLGGLAASITNPELQAAVDEGEINLIYIYRGLTVDNLAGPTTVVGAAVNGLCGVPYAPANCEGGEIEFFIDPAYYDPVTKELNLAFPTVIEAGYTEVDVGTLSLPFPTDLGPVELTLCNLIVSGTVYEKNGELSGITGGLLTGAITEDSLKELIEKGMGMPWDLAKAVLGDSDTICTVYGIDKPAYSVRLESSAIAVDLYELPPWY